MADEITLIQRLGWDWRDDGVGMGLGPGVLLSVVASGRTLRAFVPLSHVMLAFDNELQKVGCVGMAITMAPTMTAAMGSVPVDKAGVGSAVINSMRQVGGALGIAVMGTVVAAHVTVAPGAPGYASEFVDGYHLGLHVAAGFACAPHL